ncbi:hypothetical protein PFICI_00426 [Pestalotiopsis fici W106-1]|uniref:Beta-xylosidase n=1 Tax=Pestalotiopsis fici (strain W106-1 / CGMCC3.15140) TaxID=1229662 RepID=W3XKL2_PESFW|nr:uncharacterized protein PFICI_00426 [Pestalotiopsis fici W106-1]ETS86598.1 hypothetical protein PFICI_00426 [Pestalotiopsis fici W106-1]
MSFNQHHGHRPSLTAGEPIENQIATSPIDTDFSVPTTPVDSVFSHSSVSSSSSSPMDISFTDSFPRECSTSSNGNDSMATPTNPIVSPTAACFNTQPVIATLQNSCSSSSALPIPGPTHLAQPSQTFSAHRLSSLHDQPLSGHSSSIKKQNPAFAKKLQEMALPLAPLVQLTTGLVHPSFPSTLLRFWLLTDAELEGLAHFYHQRTPCRWTFHYPCPVAWETGLALEEKRRRIGKFIGLRGCETPVRVRSEDEIMEEARRAREREDEDEVWRRKLHWY